MKFANKKQQAHAGAWACPITVGGVAMDRMEIKVSCMLVTSYLSSLAYLAKDMKTVCLIDSLYQTLLVDVMKQPQEYWSLANHLEISVNGVDVRPKQLMRSN